jgi:hypothetical protein
MFFNHYSIGSTVAVTYLTTVSTITVTHLVISFTVSVTHRVIGSMVTVTHLAPRYETVTHLVIGSLVVIGLNVIGLATHLVIGSLVVISLNVIGLAQEVLLLQVVSVQVWIGTVCTINQASWTGLANFKCFFMVSLNFLPKKLDSRFRMFRYTSVECHQYRVRVKGMVWLPTYIFSQSRENSIFFISRPVYVCLAVLGGGGLTWTASNVY